MRVLLTALLCSAATMASAANFNVTTTLDSGAGSLRQAILNSNAASGAPHSISFSTSSYPLNGTINLQSNLPLITSSRLNILGNDRNPLINGGNLRSILLADTGITLDVRNIRFANGLRGSGGCIALNTETANGSLTVIGSSFVGCRANDAFSAGGGAIHWNANGNGVVSIESSSFLNNIAITSNTGNEQPRGGAIQSTTLTILRNNVFEGNSAQSAGTQGGFGGALSLFSPSGIFNSEISGNRFKFNSATVGTNNYGWGGAIDVYVDDGGSLYIYGNYFRGNSGNEGGGLSVRASTDLNSSLTLQNNTFYNNSVVSKGGALALRNIRLTADHNTYFNNDGGAAGHLFMDRVKVLRLVHQAFAPTAAGTPCELLNIDTTSAYFAGNLHAAACGALSSTGSVITPFFAVSQIDETELIGVIRFAPDSAPIDGGSLTPADCLPSDARGNNRPVDGDADGVSVCDPGAYEHPSANLFRNGFE